MLKAGIVCNDEGGSQIVSHWVLNSRNYKFLYSLSGPAVKVFKENLFVQDILSLEDLVEQCDLLICGTSWQSDSERMAIKLFKKRGKKTIAILDHWANYRERFSFSNYVVYPDEIWVVDRYAFDIAKNIFQDIPIKKIANSYFASISNELSLMQDIEVCKERILYVCEPIKEHAFLQEGCNIAWGYTEEDALNYFLANVSKMPITFNEITIRPHPSEPRNKYDWAKNMKGLNINIGGKKSLLQEIMSSNYIIGCESMAMVIGLLANKAVYCSIPPYGRDCILPHKQIVPIKDFLN